MSVVVVVVEKSGAKLAPSEACSLMSSCLAELGSGSLASVLGGNFSSQEAPLRVLSAAALGASCLASCLPAL